MMAGDDWHLSSHVPHFMQSTADGGVGLTAVADWLADNIFDELEPAGEAAWSWIHRDRMFSGFKGKSFACCGGW
jgi:hypothetical protein